MAYSTQTAVSDGTLESLPLTIEYIDRDNITVIVDLNDGEGPKEYVTGTIWNWVGTESIQFEEPLPNGAVVVLRRATEVGTLLNKFTTGAMFNAPTLDENFDQMLFLVQEAREGAGLTGVFNALNMHGFRIQNLGDGAYDRDAANIGQVRDLVRSSPELQRTLRVAREEAPLAQLPGPEVRGGKLLAFDSAGRPTVAAPVEDSATDVRLDLADPDKGAAMVARGVVAVDSIADLLALPEGARRGDLRYLVQGYHAGSAVGGGELYWDAASTATHNGGTVFAVAGVAVGRFRRRFSGDVDVTWFGARGDGTSDDTASIQAAIDYANTQTDARPLYGVSLFNVVNININIPKGYYKISSTINLYGYRCLSLICKDTAAIIADGEKDVTAFTGSNIWKLYVDGLTFVNFDTVFDIASGNLDFSQWEFRRCSVQKVNCFVDSQSYSLSRSTNVIFSGCASQYGVVQFARLYCDKVSFNNCWLGHTHPNSSLIYGNSLFSFTDCMFTPINPGFGKAFIQLSDDNGSGGKTVDINRAVTIVGGRVSNESGSCPLVVCDYDVLSEQRAACGPFVSITGTSIVGYHNSPYEDGGIETGVIQILKYPESITFTGCAFYSLGGPGSYLVAKNSTLTQAPHGRFNICLDDQSRKSAGVSANNFESTSKIANSLRGSINNPDPSLFKDIMEFGYLRVVDTATPGTKKATFTLRAGWGGPVPGTTPATFLLVLTGQNRPAAGSAAYAGSSVYLVTLSGYNSGETRHAIHYTKLHGPSFGLGLSSNSDIISLHFGSEDTGIANAPLAFDQTITVVFGTDIRFGKAKVINYIERDGHFVNKPLV